MDDESPAGEPATTGCQYCGNDGAGEESQDNQRDGDADVYQVIVLCAACKRPFATIARN